MERLGVNSVQLMLGIHMMQVCGLLLPNWVSLMYTFYVLGLLIKNNIRQNVGERSRVCF